QVAPQQQMPVAQAPNGYQPPAPFPTAQAGVAQPQPLPPALTTVPNVAPTAEARQIDETPSLDDGDSENMDILANAPAAEESPFSGLKLQTPESDTPAAAEPEEDVELPTDTPKAKDDTTAKMRQLAAIRDKAGFKGFCPVALKNNRELVPSRADFQAEYRGRLYEFSSADAKAQFEKNPHEFAPVNSGFDTVTLVEDEERKDGSLDHAAWYRGRLYMFANQANLDIFLSAPEEYAAEEIRPPKLPAGDAPQLKSEAELEADEAPVLNAEPDEDESAADKKPTDKKTAAKAQADEDSDPFVDGDMDEEEAPAAPQSTRKPAPPTTKSK
ncbi:MAG TPA: hypothetical protein VHB77_19405, partial [Planctomycetaceae bacterium]|nr:hypothetical protein [Planctomycetaceae bacterium]